MRDEWPEFKVDLIVGNATATPDVGGPADLSAGGESHRHVLGGVDDGCVAERLRPVVRPPAATLDKQYVMALAGQFKRDDDARGPCPDDGDFGVHQSCALTSCNAAFPGALRSIQK